MTGVLPVVGERDADAGTRAIYDDIRTTLGIPTVNLLWCHLATVPGALPWCWPCVKPLYTTGVAAAGAEALYAGLRWPPVRRLTGRELAAAGLDDAARMRLDALLARYERVNAVNLLALTALRRRLARRPLQPSGPARDRRKRADASGSETPDVVAAELEDLTPEARSAVLELNRLGAAREPPFVAVVWRQLAGWPALPALLLAVLRPLEARGLLRQLARTVAGESARLGAELMPRLAVAGEPPDAAGIAAALDPFLDDALPRTVALVALVRTASSAGHTLGP